MNDHFPAMLFQRTSLLPFVQQTTSSEVTDVGERGQIFVRYPDFDAPWVLVSGAKAKLYECPGQPIYSTATHQGKVAVRI